MSEVQQVPAGWYPDDRGQQRWWDGQRWGVVAQPALVVHRSKDVGVAYLLWFFLGGFGAHRFYVGSTGAAVMMLMLNIAGWVLTVVFVGWFLLAAFWIWWIVDAFLLPGYVRNADTS